MSRARPAAKAVPVSTPAAATSAPEPIVEAAGAPEAGVIADNEPKQWVQMTIGLEGTISLAFGDKHEFPLREAERLRTAGGAIFCDPPAA